MVELNVVCLFIVYIFNIFSTVISVQYNRANKFKKCPSTELDADLINTCTVLDLDVVTVTLDD